MASISLELCAARTSEEEITLAQAVADSHELGPEFLSVTYGAGGSNREATEQTVDYVRNHQTAPVVPHLTSVGHTKEELRSFLTTYQERGVDSILALRGDKPHDGGSEDDAKNASELISLIRLAGEFTIGVAAHPDGHPDSPDRQTDLKYQASKLKLADYAITQFFFQAESYYRLVDELAQLGADKPVIPGILLPGKFSAVERIAGISGITIPGQARETLAKADADGTSEFQKVVVDQASELCAELIEAGVPGLHFFTLNKLTAAKVVAANLQVHN